ncbi:N(5)-(carboxyethyl)ornithine synthase [Acetanaerobacterium elongatum]|uniref:N5-(Carboxyethyl)ornithine synthase n=1 Tax=Acetanaerobacterium elongatum TaxID=258515 RepID=A0A1G9Z3V8_9FIRM|nr:N(5)-(carboxyethyl)ornithine synthase [Acetanaerobacterium elongatum]SDN15999.1 N5-(carboxyethyl)ornithine synthase [Acetanaerobacterium elongatum]
MKTIGFPISRKENENRRAIFPVHIANLKAPDCLYFEKGYGEILGISDEEYKACGCHVCDRNECLTKDIICDPKIGDAEYLSLLSKGQTIFGWVHATQNPDITNKLINSQLTAYAWEKMYYKGRHVFWRNNELAGEAAVMHAFQCFGRMPYETKAAVLGKGNTARGAMKVLNMLGAQVVQYDRHMEDLLREELRQYDVIVNCILWDVTRQDHIIYREDLRRMKKNSMIIDVSCDRNGGIETCIPTTIENPTYIVDGVLHYAVDHTPSLFYKTFSENNSAIIWPYLEQLMSNHQSEILTKALIVHNGIIIDEEINKYQNRL